MNNLPHSALINEANLALKDHNLRVDILAQNADQIILFGSWAAGLQRNDSDVDILCVGRGPRIKSRSLDLIWIEREEVNEQRWLGSELATHIAGFGIWLSGADKWSSKAHTSVRAVDRKTRRLRSLLHALEVSWHELALPLRRRYARSFSRDLLRLDYLLSSCPVAPTAIIDRQLEHTSSAEILKDSDAVRLHRDLGSDFAHALMSLCGRSIPRKKCPSLRSVATTSRFPIIH
jgi:hypothetical protein